MTTEQQTWALFIGIGLVLLLASGIGWYLKRRIAPNQPHAVIDNLNARINAWWLMVGAIGGAFLFGETGVLWLFGFVSFIALREFLTISYTRRGDHWALSACFFVFLPLQYLLIAMDWYGLYSILIPVYAFLLLPILSMFLGDSTRFLERTAKIQWALMICVLCISYVPALLTLDIEGYQGRNLLLIAFLVVVVQASDVLQYVFGKLFGKRRIAPNLSPSKTWAGFLGGVASASLLGMALFWITPFSLVQAAGVSLLICLMGFFGGLVMSAIKRDRGIKDWGQMIEGHGGMLDRLDSICFAAPVFFHVLRYWWT